VGLADGSGVRVEPPPPSVGVADGEPPGVGEGPGVALAVGVPSVGVGVSGVIGVSVGTGVQVGSFGVSVGTGVTEPGGKVGGAQVRITVGSVVPDAWAGAPAERPSDGACASMSELERPTRMPTPKSQSTKPADRARRSRLGRALRGSFKQVFRWRVWRAGAMRAGHSVGSAVQYVISGKGARLRLCAMSSEASSSAVSGARLQSFRSRLAGGRPAHCR